MQGGGLRQDPRDKPSELQYVMLKIVFNHDPTIKLLKWPQPKKGKTTQPSLCLIHIYIYIYVCVCVYAWNDLLVYPSDMFLNHYNSLNVIN